MENKTMGVIDYATNEDYGSFVHIINSNDTRALSCHCSKCGNTLGVVRYAMFYHIRMISDTIPTETLEKIVPVTPDVGDFITRCDKCGMDTVHYVLDYNLAEVIQKLNEIGLETIFSCEGHTYSSYGFDSPYIAFKDDISHCFNMDSPLLKYWDLEMPEDELAAYGCILRVSIDASMRYITTNKFAEDLLEYINTFLS